MLKTSADFKAWLQTWSAGIVTSIAGLPDSAPAEFKAIFQTFKDKVNAVLAGLPPTDQVPAAQEMSWGLSCMQNALTEATYTIDRLRDRFPTMVIAGAQAMVEQKITAGELLTAEAVAALVKNKSEEARIAGEKAATERMTLLNTRRTAVAAAGLPEMPESLLVGEQAAFDTAITTATARNKKLNDGGMTGIEVRTLAGLVYGPEDSFNGQFATFERFITAGKGKPAPVPDPFKGGTPTAKKFVGVC